MIELACRLHDSRRAAAHNAMLRVYRDGTIVRGEPFARTTTIHEVDISDRVGNIPRRLEFDDGIVAEVDDNDAVDRALRMTRRRTPWLGRVMHTLESRWHWILAATVVTAVAMFLLVDQGIPRTADHLARTMPADIRSRIGEEGLQRLDRSHFEPSGLTEQDRERLHARFEAVSEAAGVPAETRVVFRSAPDIGPNAFALPGGIIVVTDELVALAEHDEEVIGVLAHELGHVEHRHGLRRLLQGAATGMLVVIFTGDASSIVAALPLTMIDAHYSRAFETEADEAARRYLLAADVPLHRYADILARIDKEYGGGHGRHLLATHPPTEERRRMFVDGE